MPTVSIIVTTKNSSWSIDRCLESIKKQTYPIYELIVVDNKSEDNTVIIACKYTNKIFIYGQERSAQRNFGVLKSKGKYIFIIDSDMYLNSLVVEGCIKKIKSNSNIKALIIPEVSIGTSFWARCKTLERSYYHGIDWIEAPRFFERKLLLEIGGYNNKLYAGEDSDIYERVRRHRPAIVIDRVTSVIKHDEGRLSLFSLLRKKYYYGKNIMTYKDISSNMSNYKFQSSLLGRYKLFLFKPEHLLKRPTIYIGMLLMKTLEFAAGGLGLLMNSVSKASKNYN